MKYHFTPPQGWMNDPNGTIYVNDIYHLFYQYYPYDTVWGPMHWGHAVTKDLVHWTHKNIALKPDELGYIFSGSCIYDEDKLVVMYTSHNPNTQEQQQCIAYSLDSESFVPYEHNPVISNKVGDVDYKVDFRDPKIFKNDILGGYSVALAVGRRIEFYHTDNLLDWEKTGEFDPAENGFDGICECPDCFRLKVEGREDYRWILSLSSILDEDKVGLPLSERGYSNPRVMQYFVGEFDGRTFVDTERYEEPLVLDYGTDNYAMVSFAGLEDVVMIGWGEHWDYAAELPEMTDRGDTASGHRGKMTLARKAGLVYTDRGYRLAFDFVDATSSSGDMKFRGADRINLDAGVEISRYIIQPEDKLELTNSFGSVYSIALSGDSIIVDRTAAVAETVSSFLKKDSYNVFRAKRYTEGSCEILVVEDEGYVELLADGGLIPFSFITL